MIALLRSAHPGPAVAVTLVAVILAIGAGLEPWRIVLLGLAMILDQLSVGWSNDAIDTDRDRASGRRDKPVALGLVSRRLVLTVALVAAGASVLLFLPLGWAAAAAHLVFLASAWAYNLGLKATVLSIAPYLVSFGLLPSLVTLSSTDPALAPWWATGAGALLGAAAHVANVLPDLADDAATGVRGLPHRFGLTTSGVVIAISLAVAGGLVVVGPGSATPWGVAGLVVIVVIAVVIVARVRRPTRLLFQLIMAAALLDVVLLATSGGL